MINKDCIYNMDCMEGLRQLPDNCADAIITDPPYGIDFQSCHKPKEERFDKIQNDKLPFIWFLYDSSRILKDGGRLVVFCREDVQEIFRIAIETAGFNILSHVVWDKKVHTLGDLDSSFAPCHEILWYATKGKYIFQSGRPQSVLRFQRIDGIKLKHPNEKPIELMRHLLLKLTKEGELVIDPFAGSGTTLVACKQLRRNYIGFELDAKYCDIAKEKLSQVNLYGF